MSSELRTGEMNGIKFASFVPSVKIRDSGKMHTASDMTVAEVLYDFPELTETDIRACFAYAADKEKS